MLNIFRALFMTSFGIPAISYDANCKGSLSYLNLAKELVDNNENVKVSW